MCGLVLLIMGIVYLTRIPKLQRSSPSDFPYYDPAVHEEWRKKELGGIYVFLAATWGVGIFTLMIAFAVGMAMVGEPAEKIDNAIWIVQIVQIVLFLAGLVWSGIFGTQAARLKKRLMTPTPTSYYPRPGQVPLQSPPQPTPVSAPPQAQEQTTAQAAGDQLPPPQS